MYSLAVIIVLICRQMGLRLVMLFRVLTFTLLTENVFEIYICFYHYRLTRIKIEDSALVKNMLLFQNRDSQPIDLAEFAGNLNITAEDGSLISLFKMHTEVKNIRHVRGCFIINTFYFLMPISSKQYWN